MSEDTTEIVGAMTEVDITAVQGEVQPFKTLTQTGPGRRIHRPRIEPGGQGCSLGTETDNTSI